MLAKLKEYQELIAILVFFLGGFFWLESQFPQKTDLESVKTDLQKENAVLKCLLKKNMVLVQDQIQASALEKSIKEKNEYIYFLSEKLKTDAETISPVMQFKLTEAREEVAAKKDELKTVITRMQDTKNELERNICGEGG